MARPTIVRADTIDLQDTEAPHAANHTKQVSTDSVAPHQASQFQNIADERHTEEQILADAWAMSGNAVNEPTAPQQGQDEDKIEQDGAGHGVEGTEEDDGEQDADDDLMDRISSSPSIDDEDIDFEFVYALHTFVATVEGQANATKGDTMVLLDDSNSYWWLVRVVKDSSIGYLPAEHIETPTERLARLNKHRNIDLSQTMLGDNPEKSRNPLKMAMRRRNAKTVQFAAPTYVEASDYDYSDDEEPAGSDTFTNGAPVDDPAVNGQPVEVEERNAPEEANVHATRRYSGDQASIASRNSVDSVHKASFDGSMTDDPQLSPKLVDRSEAAPLKSRKGTPRNTDSFLKDDSIETRKITLTPGLLREDGANGSKNSSMDSQRNPSMESLTKVTSPTESSSTTSSKKDTKDKKKDKQKGGMLSGLFKSKKKDKKGAKDDDAAEERASLDGARTASPQLNGRASPADRSSNVVTAAAAAAGRDVQVQTRNTPTSAAAPATQPSPARPSTADTPAMAELQGSEAAHEMMGTVPDQPTNKEAAASILKQAPKAKRAKQRVELDDFDGPDDLQDPFDDPEEREHVRVLSPSGTITDGADFVHIPTSFNDDEVDEPSTHVAHEGPPKKSEESLRNTTDDDTELFADARSTAVSPTMQRGDAAQPPARPAPLEPPVRGNSTSSQSSVGNEADTPKSASVVSHDGKHVAWDDGALRAWLDAEEVKDMLTIVHSSGPLEPVSDDHPIMRGLYADERSSVQRMMTDLDSLVMDFANRHGLA
ncbi:hypothetical protein AMS68_000517 [Peltaster fructicola]|uniref:SH3 domain-containing protein n=1 Tax=Peltaster fructicola TaxID=286661 RepID=A0A6H0XKG0_9PEZI|nr:hypothetical protein AMS68_000517 [Peltaster fructicola]